MTKQISVEFLGNSKVTDVFFFNRDIDGILKDFKGESFSAFLAVTADRIEYFGRGFSAGYSDLSVKVLSGDDILYKGPVYLDESDESATPDEVRAEFLTNNYVEYDSVLSYNEFKCVSPDRYMLGLSKYKKCIVRQVDLDGYNGLSKLDLTVADDFKLSDLKIIVSNLDHTTAPQTADLIITIFGEDFPAEIIGIEYKGAIRLITNDTYKSDLIKEPYTFIGTTSYAAYIYNGEEWEDDPDVNFFDLGELGETEE